MPPPDWFSWEFWAAAAHAVLSGIGCFIAWIWAGYVANRENIIPLVTLIAGGVGVPLLVAFAANQRAKIADMQARITAQRNEEQTSADRERRIAESFAKSGEQLGSDKLEPRLVGIYTLEHIAVESERYYWPIMEMLTAYVREHAPWPPRRQVLAHPFVELQGSCAHERDIESTPAGKAENEVEQASIQVRPATDIQAILTVLGRRDEWARKRNEAAKRHLNLTRSDLRGAVLARAHLEGADLREAHLEGADLGGAVGLTQEQLDVAFGDDRTLLPDGLNRPVHWPAAVPEEPDNAE